MFQHSDPVVAWCLVADSSADQATRCVAGYGPAFWGRLLGVAVEPLVGLGYRRFCFRGPWGHRGTDEPRGELSFRALNFARMQAPHLVTDFVSALSGLVGRVDEVTFYLGSLRAAAGAMTGPDPSTLIDNVLTHLAPFRTLRARGLPVRVVFDSSMGLGECGKAYWCVVEYLRAMGERPGGLKVAIEPSGHREEPRQLVVDSYITEELWVNRAPAWFVEPEGECARVCGLAATPEKVYMRAWARAEQELPGLVDRVVVKARAEGLCWEWWDEWGPAWMDEVVKGGYTAAVGWTALLGMGERKGRWKRGVLSPGS